MIPTVQQYSNNPVFEITWRRGDNTPLDLTDATVTGCIKSRRTGEVRAINGTITKIAPFDEGRFSWDVSDQDVEDYGTFDVQFKATFGDPPNERFEYSRLMPWTITRSICNG